MTRDEKLEALLRKKEYNANDLVTIVELLRLPGGCPWDREQTHKSIRNDLIEETYEVIEAIDNEDPLLLREELGDLLLQVAMHARMEEETGAFTFDDVANDVCQKMIHRHPHVFGELHLETAGQVLANWEVIKSAEKSRQTVTDKLRAIPRQYPALLRAAKVGKKAKMMDFPDAVAVADKVSEELLEVREALAAANGTALSEEIGDLLLSVASLARKAGVDPELALTRATDKFIDRFEAVEQAATALGKDLSVMSDAEKDVLWENAKKIAKNR
ncbi:MAG: nucleoside triphosphate pyrophosphohydrolase [Ruminococcaceae bacterium]|nr:nucleoside triphosphate pyrophosphohydrolase [Oscillospiraceae bacterium]